MQNVVHQLENLRCRVLGSGLRLWNLDCKVPCGAGQDQVMPDPSILQVAVDLVIQICWNKSI